MDFSEFAQCIENIHQETSSNSSGVPAAEVEIDFASQAFPLLSAPEHLRSALASILTMGGAKPTTVPDLAVLLSAPPASSKMLTLTSDDALRILGYSSKIVTYPGAKYRVYQSGEYSTGCTFRIPEGFGRVFDSYLLRCCYKMAAADCLAGDLYVREDTVADAAFAKGGPYRRVDVVSVGPGGNLFCSDSSSHLVYDIRGVTRITICSDGELRTYPFTGQVASCFIEQNLILDPKGAHDFGQGVRANGPFDPASFVTGCPDQSEETLDIVVNLLSVSKTDYRRRFKAFILRTSSPRTTKARMNSRQPPCHVPRHSKARAPAPAATSPQHRLYNDYIGNPSLLDQWCDPKQKFCPNQKCAFCDGVQRAISHRRGVAAKRATK